MAKSSLKDNAHELSSFANNAYQILANDIDRAEYLIKLHSQMQVEGKIASFTSDKGDSQEHYIIDDPELTERVFELRFTISESNSQTELAEIKEALARDYK